jgi:hypothetical protein
MITRINVYSDPNLGVQSLVAAGFCRVSKNLNIFCAGILNNLWGARNRVEIGMSYQPARLYTHSTQPCGIVSVELILRLLKS